MTQMANRLFQIVVGCAVVVTGIGSQQIASADEIKSRPQRTVSPERVLRRFAVALISGDRKALEENTSAHAELDVLLGGKRPSGAALSMIREKLENTRVRTHKAGESIKLPNNATYTVPATMVSENSRVMTLAAMPIPMVVVRVEGQWKVDPTPLIEAKKATADKKTSRE